MTLARTTSDAGGHGQDTELIDPDMRKYSRVGAHGPRQTEGPACAQARTVSDQDRHVPGGVGLPGLARPADAQSRAPQ